MTTKGEVDAGLQENLELDPSDSYYTSEWVPKALRLLTKVVYDFWAYAPWDFKIGGPTNISLVGPADNADLPADFLRVGTGGKVVVPGQGPVHYKRPMAFNEVALAPTPPTGPRPFIYTIQGRNVATSRVKAFFSPYPPSGTTVTIRLMYEIKRPTLVYQDTAGHGMEYIPEEYHESVILPGLIDLLGSQIVDGRTTQELSPRFANALRMAAAEREHGLEEIQQYGDDGIPEEEMW